MTTLTRLLSPSFGDKEPYADQEYKKIRLRFYTSEYEEREAKYMPERVVAN
jgi:hypothetical protein